MKILAIADHEDRWLWDHYEKEKLADVDLILSCGDLDPRYLSFLVTFAPCDLYYVHGNHDKRYKTMPPEGCICLEDKITVVNGIRILGLGGSMEYVGGPHQYTEDKMARRIARLRLKISRYGGFDVLVTHSPAFGIGDGKDLPHRGFACFLELLDRYQPKLMIHGHQHKTYSAHMIRSRMRGKTQIINAYEKCFFEYETGKILL